MANDFASIPGKKKVGLVELADGDLDIFHRYTQSDEWETELVIVNGPGTHAERMARILGLPVHEFPHRELLARCDLIVIGDPSSQQYAPIREMMAGTRARVVLLDELRAELAGEGASAAPAPPAEEEPKDEIDRALDLLIGPEASETSGTGPAAPHAPGPLSHLAFLGNASTGESTDSPDAPGETGSAVPDPEPEFEMDAAYTGTEDAGSGDTLSTFQTAPEPEVEFAPEPEAVWDTEPVEAEAPPTLEPEPEAATPSPWLEAPEADTEAGETEDLTGAFPTEAALAGGPSADSDEEESPSEREVLQPAPESEPRFLVPEPEEAYDLPTVEEGIEPFEAGTPVTEAEADLAPPTETVPEPEPVAEPVSEPIAEPEPEPVAEPEPEPVAESEPEPMVELEPEPGPIAEPIAEPAPEPVAELQPEAGSTPAAGADNPGCYDLSPFLGGERSRDVGPLPVDGRHPGLTAALDHVRSAAGAKAVSLMLPEAGCTHLRIAAASGLGDDTIRTSRFPVGEGLAGTAFSTGELQTRLAEVPGFAEDGGSVLHKLAVGYPLAPEGHVGGVLVVTVESGETVDRDAVVGALTAHHGALGDLVLDAVDMSALDPDTLRALLGRHLDRIMAREAPFPDRILAMGGILGAAVGADFTHLYLVDPVNRRLEAVSEPAGMTSASGGYLPLEQGVFGWALDRGEPMLSTLPDPSGEREHAVAYLPIRVSGPYGILVLENFVVETARKPEILKTLGSVMEQLEDIYQVEQSVTSHDIVSEIQLRIADKAAGLSVLPEELRTQPTLEIVVQELDAEAAIWLSTSTGAPVITQPRTREAARIVADAWDHLDEVGTWVRERGSAAVGRSGSGWEAEGPQAPAPYVGVKDESGDGVILVLFAADDGSPATPSLPAGVLTGALAGVCRLLHAGSHPEPVHISNAEDTEILDAEALAKRIREEIHRSGRSGLPFTVTRFSYEEPDGASMEDLGFLRHFLLTHKRGADTLADLDGTFVLLSPDSDPSHDRIRVRFQETWDREGSELTLSIQGQDPAALAGGVEQADSGDRLAA